MTNTNTGDWTRRFGLRQALAAFTCRGATVRAPASVHSRKGESPFQACVTMPVVEGNCVAARRGGKQPETNDRSVIK